VLVAAARGATSRASDGCWLRAPIRTRGPRDAAERRRGEAAAAVGTPTGSPLPEHRADPNLATDRGTTPLVALFCPMATKISTWRWCDAHRERRRRQRATDPGRPDGTARVVSRRARHGAPPRARRRPEPADDTGATPYKLTVPRPWLRPDTADVVPAREGPCRPNARSRGANAAAIAAASGNDRGFALRTLGPKDAELQTALLALRGPVAPAHVAAGQLATAWCCFARASTSLSVTRAGPR
jgi:hypothetical protein